MERLTHKQKVVIRMLVENNESCSATSFVESCSVKIGCSKSAMWNALNALKNSGLAEFGSTQKRVPVRLTRAGLVLSCGLTAEKKEDESV